MCGRLFLSIESKILHEYNVKIAWFGRKREMLIKYTYHLGDKYIEGGIHYVS